MASAIRLIPLILLIWQGVVAEGFKKFPSTSRNCDLKPEKCCLVVTDGHKTPISYIEFPENGRITGDFTYLNDNGAPTHFSPQKVTIKHYHPVTKAKPDSTEFYFNADQEQIGHFSDVIHWKPGEVARYGQKLAVCAVQSFNPGRKDSYYTMEVYAEIPV